MLRSLGAIEPIDLAGFAGQAGAGRWTKAGSAPFMALDLLSESRPGRIPRRYRHEAESFAWSLICLCLATAVGKDDKDSAMTPHPLESWFGDRERSRCARVAYRWSFCDHSEVQMAYPDAKYLACPPHCHWVDRYNQELYGREKVAEEDLGSGVKELMRIFNCKCPSPAYPPYKELDDGYLFRELLMIYNSEVGSLEGIKGVLVELAKKYSRVIRAI